MGWLMMYCAVFMLMTTAMINFQFERRDQYDVDRAGATAAQMFLWHRAAVQACLPPPDPANPGSFLPSPCPDGPVQTAMILPQIGNAIGYLGVQLGSTITLGVDGANDQFLNGKFFSLADNEDGLIVTYYSNQAASGVKSENIAGMIVAQMSVGNGWSAMQGFYDAAYHRVDRVSGLADNDPAVMEATLPATFGGSTIPDQAPVIVTRY